MSKKLTTHLDSQGVLSIVLNRPEVHNAFNEELVIGLTEVLAEAADNLDVKLIVLEAEGMHFCAGADFQYMKRMSDNSREQNIEDTAALASLLKTLDTVPQPTIAKVHGAAYGAGVGLICCCDIAVGGTSTVVSLNEVKVGLVPAAVAPYVSRAVGNRIARRLVISGERVAAHAAQSMGMLHSVVEDELLDDAVDGIIDALLENSLHAMIVAKEIALKLDYDVLDDDLDAYLIDTVADIVESEEGREGTAALVEKRCASWVQ